MESIIFFGGYVLLWRLYSFMEAIFFLTDRMCQCLVLWIITHAIWDHLSFYYIENSSILLFGYQSVLETCFARFKLG